MRYMVMHKVDAHMEAGGPPPKQIVEGMGKYIGDAIASGVFKDGAGLHRSARRVRVSINGGKRTITRGPYAGGNELLASFTMISAESLEHATEIAARVAAELGDAEIEVGPVVEAWDLGFAEKPEGVPERFLLLLKADRAFESGTARAVPDGFQTLAPSRRGARIDGKRKWIDGPFAESKELIAGFSIVELPSLADAKRWAEAYQDILGDIEVDVRELA